MYSAVPSIFTPDLITAALRHICCICVFSSCFTNQQNSLLTFTVLSVQVESSREANAKALQELSEKLQKEYEEKLQEEQQKHREEIEKLQVLVLH